MNSVALVASVVTGPGPEATNRVRGIPANGGQ